MQNNQTLPLTILSPNNSRTFHINLAPKHKRSISAQFRAKLAPNNIHYLELELFKQRLQGDQATSSHHTYLASYDRVRWYRSVFFAFGIVFLGLSVLIFHQKLVFFAGLFGGISTATKNILASFPLLLALVSIGMGYSLCIAKEASGTLAEKAKRKLIRSYARKRIKQGFHGFAFLKNDMGKQSVLKHQYIEALDLITEQHDETLHLLQKIQKYTLIDPCYRELLFNQALAEMNDRMQNIVTTFH
ncbi:MAG: hypothetical protein H0W50_03400 [Parachlamydiaceae bacterium]|nr:hypothetical protein [Parachlamydiaceae bacterium]